ncbi:MAG TPA: TonB-dependent receptor [Candidatus Acidoferrum sp.]|nr:TonB-dependent receptor [Candidatus Acidoferrum sp.]
MHLFSFLYAQDSLRRSVLPGRRLYSLGLLLFSTIFLTTGLRAQTTSTIEGTVTDHQGLAIAEAKVQIAGATLAVEKSATTDATGAYEITALPAGIYTLTVSHTGFSTQVFKDLEITLNRTMKFDVSLEIGTVQQEVQVIAPVPLLETTSSSEGATVLPQQIEEMPINGRNYLDLLQLVPGVAIYRQADLNSDNATPILGERANNTGFLIDGLANENELAGGAASQFNQDTIAEFQVITTGYKAEFGHSSGGVVNVITKSGGNNLHGLASAYHRNNVFDSSDVSNQSTGSVIPGQTEPPYLLRWDYDVSGGGAMVKDKAFWFASVENIHENQALNFVPPPKTPQFLLTNEETYNEPTKNNEARVFGKFDQRLGSHLLSEEVNYTNLHLNSTNPLSASTALPSTRSNLGDRNLFLGFNDVVTFGSSGSPFILNLRGQYRGEATLTGPAHPQAGPDTIFNIFSSYTTGGLFGDVGTPEYGALFTQSTINQKYGIFGANLGKTFGRHAFKFGWDFERTHVNGVEANAQQDQLFATEADYQQFGPIDAGFFLLLTTGGLTPQANDIKLRNNYDGLWIQDDWKVLHNLTLNLGVRWDYDSAFQIAKNVSPRLGFAWAVNSKTVVRGSFGEFYDHFRLGLVRDVPGFGGADIRESQPLSFPRLFYGVPTIAPALFGLCLSPTQTDAQLAAAKATCPFAGIFEPPGAPIYGVDHLNNIGPTPIPGNSVVTMSNVQQLSGLSPSAFLTAADAATGMPSNFWLWGPFGALSFLVLQPSAYQVTIDPSFSTPFTRSYTLGIQRQITDDMVVSLDYYHKDIINILGMRQTNLAFAARIANNSTVPFVNGYGPWYGGTYDGGILSFNKRFSQRFTFGGSYSYVSENDDALNSNLVTGALGGGNLYPTDSYRGIVPVVTDPGNATCSPKTNATAAFFACNGNYVPKAGIFYNGATLDNGPSDFALRHTFELHGLVQLPWKFQFSSLLRAQSGFRFTAVAVKPIDQDGNGNFDGRDLKTARNGFSAPAFVNMDTRISKTWVIRERVRLTGMFEFFNLFNTANAAAMQAQQAQAATFDTVSERLPGREGQVGLRIEF